MWLFVVVALIMIPFELNQLNWTGYVGMWIYKEVYVLLRFCIYTLKCIFILSSSKEYVHWKFNYLLDPSVRVCWLFGWSVGRFYYVFSYFYSFFTMKKKREKNGVFALHPHASLPRSKNAKKNGSIHSGLVKVILNFLNNLFFF